MDQLKIKQWLSYKKLKNHDKSEQRIKDLLILQFKIKKIKN
jgi:hypothetical protein